MKCVVILQDMCVEEGINTACNDGEKIPDCEIVGEGQAPIWIGLVQMHGAAQTDKLGTIATLYPLEAYKGQKEHDLTKRLLIEQL